MAEGFWSRLAEKSREQKRGARGWRYVQGLGMGAGYGPERKPGFWESLFRTTVPPPLWPETPLGEVTTVPVMKGLEWALTPFAWSGMNVRGATEMKYPLIWSSLFKPPAAWEGQPMTSYIPGGEEYEEYRQLPEWQQLAYESPAWALTMAAPSAGTLRAGLRPAAEAGQWLPRAARATLAPIETVETAVSTAARAGIRYGLVIPVREGIPAAWSKALQVALDRGLDMRVAKWGRLNPERLTLYQRTVMNFFSIGKNRNEFIELATNNMLRRRAEGMGMNQAVKTAVEDTLTQAEPLLLKAAEQAGARPAVTKKQALSLLTEQVARGETPSAELLEKMGIRATAPELPTGITTEPTVGVGTATNAQKAQIHLIAKDKGLLSELGKPRPQYRRLAKAMTGETSAANMTEEEANVFIRALEGVVARGGGRPPRIPVGTGLITEEFAKKIPLLNEIGVLERVRPTRQVFEKIGLRHEIWEPAFESELRVYEEAVAFRRELNNLGRTVSAESRPRIFEALENPTKVAGLNPNEAAAYQWFRKFFDDWANKLGLVANKRRTNYVTHIFEESIAQDLAAKHPLDPEIIRAMDFASPRTVFNPYLQQRLGQTAGLIEDPFLAANAYEARALRVFHYEPLIQRIRAYEKYLPPNSARYLRDFISRITNRPLPIDRELSQTLKDFGQTISKLPHGEQLAAQLTGGNAGGLAAYNYTSLLYFLWLGFKPTSAIRNLSQHFLALSEVGPINFARGLALRFTAEGKAALRECQVLRSRSQALVPGIDTSFASKWADRIREASLKMFRLADRQNVSDSFLAGYAEAKALYPNAPSSMWIARGNEVAADTQYIYTRLGGAAWSQSALGRVLSPLTTWPENWLELMTRFVKDRPSYVFREFEAATGAKAAEGVMDWGTKRKALLLYLTIVGAAYAAQHKTKFRASEYTGWSSMSYLVDIAKGELPALDIPGSFAEIIGGALTGNEQLMKSGWNRIRPDQLMGIIRQFERIADGKTDWLSLFLYLNPEKSQERPGLPKLPELPELPELPKLPSLP